MVIVPTRELVQQVREVFDMCVRKTKLKVLSLLKSFLRVGGISARTKEFCGGTGETSSTRVFILSYMN